MATHSSYKIHDGTGAASRSALPRAATSLLVTHGSRQTWILSTDCQRKPPSLPTPAGQIEVKYYNENKGEEQGGNAGQVRRRSFAPPLPPASCPHLG